MYVSRVPPRELCQSKTGWEERSAGANQSQRDMLQTKLFAVIHSFFLLSSTCVGGKEKKKKDTNKQTKNQIKLSLSACLSVCPIPPLLSVIHFSPAGRQQPSDLTLLSIKTNSALQRGSCRNCVGPCSWTNKETSKHVLNQLISRWAWLSITAHRRSLVTPSDALTPRPQKITT